MNPSDGSRCPLLASLHERLLWIEVVVHEHLLQAGSYAYVDQ